MGSHPGKFSSWARKVFEGPLYSAGIAFYAAGVRVAALRGGKARKLVRGQKETALRLGRTIQPGDSVIWFHVSSLGEFEQSRPLMEMVRRHLPEKKIVLTFFSPSGYEVRKSYEGADCVCYLPFDTPGRVRRFIDAARPECAVFVKYEIWRNYLSELSRRNIPAYLICAVFRDRQKFFRRRYAWYGEWLRWFNGIFVQDPHSAELLGRLDIGNVEVCGDTRFDRVTDIVGTRKPIEEIERFFALNPKALKFMAGSSWESDENIYAGWFDDHPEAMLVVAPHEFDGHRIEKLRRRFRNGAVTFSELRENPEEALRGRPQVLVMDCFGLLSSAYAYCDVAYVGGGFGSGLHNINEAAVYEVPVIYGPNHKKFIEAREMAEHGGGVVVRSARQFAEAAAMLADPVMRRQRGNASGYYIRSKLGATQRIFKSLGLA